jgi:PAS domain S-box-containing protein
VRRRNLRLRGILALLVLATTLPLGLFAGLLILMSWQQQRTMVDHQNVDTARAISVAIDKELESTINALDVLASVDVLQFRNLRAFNQLALRLMPREPGWHAVVLVDPSGHVLVNTAAPGAEPATPPTMDWVGTVLATARPTVSSLFEEPDTGRYFVIVGVPVVENGTLQLVLGAQIRSSVLSDVLRRQKVPPNGVVTLIDRTQRIIARTRGEDLYVGKLPSENFRAAATRMTEGSWRGKLLEGVFSYSSLSRSALTGWTIGIGFPAEQIDAPIRRSIWALTGVGLVILALGVGFALLLGHLIVRSLASASLAVRALARSEPLPDRRSRLVEIEELSAGLREAASILSKRLYEREQAEQARSRAATEREQALRAEQVARAASAQDEARLAVTLRSIGDAVIATDLDSKVTVLNPVAQALTGWSETEGLRKPIERVFRIVNEDTRAPAENPVARVLRDGSAVGLANHTLLIARDGREIPIADSAAPIRGPDQALLGVVLVFRDVSEQRAAERERAALFAREQAARHEAEALSRSKDEFVATVSHELRTPLNAIFGWAKLLRSGRLDRAARDHALDVIERNTRAQARLIDDLLDMSRVITGNLRLDLRETELGAVLEGALETVRPAAEAKQLELVVSTDHPAAVVQGDPNRLQQIAWNLLTNSIKFTPPGGRIEAKISVEGAQALLCVSDTGVGIDRDFLPHVFERFRQGASSASRGYGGLGIGLALVHHLVDLHGGSVTAHSDGPNCGARFEVRLPVIELHGTTLPRVRAVYAQPSAELTGQMLDGLRILLVDDDPDARELARTALAQAGAQVNAAASVREALDLLESVDFDVLLSDIAMPNGTGYDLLRALRSSPRTSKLPAVALTAYSRAEDRERVLSAGFNFHIGKPFELSALISTLAMAAGRGPTDDRSAVG